MGAAAVSAPVAAAVCRAGDLSAVLAAAEAAAGVPEIKQGTPCVSGSHH